MTTSTLQATQGPTGAAGATGPSGSPTADGWVDDSIETWTYASADAPTYTFTVNADVTGKYSVGQRIKLTQTTVKYFIVTAVSTYSGGLTTITVYGGTDYTLANAAISLKYHSREKAPVGFPLEPEKWTVEVTDGTDRSQASPVTSTWYNLGSVSIVVPIGSWRVSYSVYCQVVNSGAATQAFGVVTLSTANNTESDKSLSAGVGTGDASASGKQALMTTFREKTFTLSAKSTRYLNSQVAATATTLANLNSISTCVIRAVCAYL